MAIHRRISIVAATERVLIICPAGHTRRTECQTCAVDVLHGINLYDEVRRYERELICAALAHTMGHQLKAAHLLGVKATTLNAKLKQYGISARNYSQTID